MHRIGARVAIAAVFIGVSSSAADAAQRTFVASNGLDSNPCSVTAPCRSFATAILNTSVSGEVIVLDSAGYGPVTITQSATIAAPPGVYAGIFVPAGSVGVTVNGSGILVTLRGLTINGQGGGLGGIHFQQGSRLYVENCLVTNINSAGLRAFATGSQVFISDSTFRYSIGPGIVIEDGTATIDRVRLENNVGGIRATPTGNPTAAVNVLVRDTVASRNGFHGFEVTTGGPMQTGRLAVERSSAIGNGGNGFQAAGAGTMTLIVSDSSAIENHVGGVAGSGPATTVIVTGSTLSRNVDYGLRQLGSAVVTTLKNNTMELNGLGPTSGTITTSTLQ